MLFKTYQKCAWDTNKTREDHRYFHMQMGFLSESANICNQVKEARREQIFDDHVTLNREVLVTEIGDSLWYLAALHSVQGIEMGYGMSTPSFDAFDQWAGLQSVLPQIDATKALYKSVIDTANAFGDPEAEFPAQQVGQHIMTLSRFCHSQNITLAEAANHNLQKIYGRYADTIIWPENGFTELGALVLDFSHNADQVIVKNGDLFVGDKLTSQVTKDDGFNYHDSLHLAFATYLGWSPVLRKLLDKRREDELDGARHVCNEEAVIDDIWTEMRKNPERKGPNWNMLVDITDKFAAHPEAGNFSYGQWEQAIKNGLDISSQLIAHKGGRVICDFVNKNMRYEYAY